MSNFNQAIGWLQQNKKIRRSFWDTNNYLILDDKIIKNNFNETVDFCNISSFLADDWELFKEPQKLMVCCVCGEIDESHSAYCTNCFRVPHRLMSKKQQEEFKEFLKRIK